MSSGSVVFQSIWMKGATSCRPSLEGIWNAYRTPGSSKLTLHPGPGWTLGCGPVGDGVRCLSSSVWTAASIAASVSNWTSAFTARSKRGGGVAGRGVRDGGRGDVEKEGTGSVGVIGSRLGPMTSLGKWGRGGGTGRGGVKVWDSISQSSSSWSFPWTTEVSSWIGGGGRLRRAGKAMDGVEAKAVKTSETGVVNMLLQCPIIAPCPVAMRNPRW